MKSQEHPESVLDFDSGPWACLFMLIGLSLVFTILRRASEAWTLASF